MSEPIADEDLIALDDAIIEDLDKTRDLLKSYMNKPGYAKGNRHAAYLKLADVRDLLHKIKYHYEKQ